MVWQSDAGAGWNFRIQQNQNEREWHECALCWMCDPLLCVGPRESLSSAVGTVRQVSNFNAILVFATYGA